MPDHFRVFPVHSTAELLNRLMAAGDGARLKLSGSPEHPLLSVLPASVTSATVADAAVRTAGDPPPINDSFPCPGSPGCPQ